MSATTVDVSDKTWPPSHVLHPGYGPPAGTLPGVSAFQVRIADYDIHTPGDAPDVLVAMNPAALKKELKDLKANGIIIVNTDEFNDRNLTKAGYAKNPLDDHSLDKYRVFQVAE